MKQLIILIGVMLFCGLASKFLIVAGILENGDSIILMVLSGLSCLAIEIGKIKKELEDQKEVK